MASEYMAIHYNIDASRIPSQIIAGIGFIGAGTIIRTGMSVRGVTTAAGILSVTCIGIAVGMGYYSAAIIATLIVYFVLSVNHEVSGKFERYEILDINIKINSNVDETINNIEDYFKKEKIAIQSMKKDETKTSTNITLLATYDSKKITKNEIISSLISLDSVSEVINDNNKTTI